MYIFFLNWLNIFLPFFSVSHKFSLYPTIFSHSLSCIFKDITSIFVTIGIPWCEDFAIYFFLYYVLLC